MFLFVQKNFLSVDDVDAFLHLAQALPRQIVDESIGILWHHWGQGDTVRIVGAVTLFGCDKLDVAYG